MRLWDLLIKEYLSIVGDLLQDHPVENDRIVIDREHFKMLLEKYAYMSFQGKTKLYKALNFIIHDKNNYTMPYKDAQLKRTVRKVIFNFSTYIAIKELHENKV